MDLGNKSKLSSTEIPADRVAGEGEVHHKLARPLLRPAARGEEEKEEEEGKEDGETVDGNIKESFGRC